MPRKRTHAEVDASDALPEKKEPSLVQNIRNMWEFASVMQYIFMFGKVLKIDEDFDIEDLENECLKPGYSDKLEEIGLQLLRFVSSNRGLNFDNWDEYVRRQYQSKAPTKRHPYGDAEEPAKFRSFDIFNKIRVLHQLTVWTFWNPDRIRGSMPDARESEQLDWRMNVFGWDDDDREYFVLDDNRLYRRTEPPLPAAPKAKPKANSIKARAARRRASKRRKLEEFEADTETHDDEENDETSQSGLPNGGGEPNTAEVDTLDGYKWECVAITLDEYQLVIDNLKTSIKNYPNERAMRHRLIEEVLPTIRELAEKQKRKQERRERELMMMERMAGAKRSSRLADKQEKEKKDQEEAEVARKRAADLIAARKEQERQEKMEQERQHRMMTREQRIKDREYKRIIMEEELARDVEEQKRIEEGEKRGSERQIRERVEKNKRELEELQGEEEWTFDCSGCGVHGKNVDDGSHSIACEKCSVWQHSKCLGISKTAAEKDDFTFVCGDCHQKERLEAKRKEEEARRKEEEANKPKIMLKFRPGQSSSPPQQPTQPVQPPPHPSAPGFVKSVDVPWPSESQSPTRSPLVKGYNEQPRPLAQQPHGHNSPQLYHRTQPMPFSSSTGSAPQPHPYNQVDGSGSYAEHFDNADGQQTGNGAFNTIQQPHQIHAGIQRERSWSHTSLHSTPKPASTQTPQQQGARIPSPILNRPKMSPTQGNPDVGPIAGVPHSSANDYHPALFTPQTNGAYHPQLNGEIRPNSSGSPTQRLSQTPLPQQLSGLSPIKQSSTLPPPTGISEMQSIKSASPPQQSSSFAQYGSSFTSSAPLPSATASFSSTSGPQGHRISGTPIFPPAQKLAPSPELMNRHPVPTPSKQPTSPNANFKVQSVAQGNGSTS